MKNERDFSVAIMGQMTRDLRGSKVIKHSDRGTVGVPDISCTWMGRTCWVETKYRRTGRHLRDILDSAQLIVCNELSVTSDGRSWIVVYDQMPQRVTIWQPRALAALMFPRVVLEDLPTKPVLIENPEEKDLMSTMRAIGALYCVGWRHAVVTQLIRNAV